MIIKNLTIRIAAVSIIVLIYLTAAGQNKPNVILIMVDDMGYECVGANGGLSYSTPNLDKIAEQGVRFTNCFSQPLCTPSRVQIMTGLYNNRNYIDWGTLNRGEKTFGHIMQDAGYVTGMAGKWQLSGDYDRDGQMHHEAGFDETCMWAYHFDLDKKDAAFFEKTSGRINSRYWHPSILQNEKFLRNTTIDDYGPDIFSNFLLDFIERHQNEPFFFYYPMTLTHGPFVPTPHTIGIGNMTRKEKNASKVVCYKDMVEYMDYIVSKIIGKLEALNLDQNTLVIFTADNGTPMGITTKISDGTFISGGKGLTNSRGTHVPLIAYWKGKTKPNLVVNDLVDFTDFLPTILDAGNVRAPDYIKFDGISFLPLLKGEEREQKREWIFCHYDTHDDYPKKWPRARYARDKRFKLYDFGLFDTKEDVLETTIINAKDMTRKAKRAQKKLQAVLDNMYKKPGFYTDEKNFTAPNLRDVEKTKGQGSNR